MRAILAVLGTLAGLFLLAVISVSIWLFTFDANEHKEWIATKFRENTGRELSLDGNIDLSFYPWLGLDIEDVSVANAVGFSATPLLDAGHAQFRVKLLPLLGGDVEIDTVRLNSVHLNLEVAGNGQDNWSSMFAGDSSGDGDESEEESGDDGSSSPTFGRIAIGGVDISEVSLVYDNNFNGTHYEINDFSLQIPALVYGDPLSIDMSMQLASLEPELSADVTLDGTALYDLERGSYQFDPLQLDATLRGPGVPSGSTALSMNTAVQMDTDADTLSMNPLALQVLGTTINAEVLVSEASTDNPDIALTLDARGEDLAVLFRVIEQPELAERIAQLENRFSISTTLQAAPGRGTVSVPRLQAQLLNADINGAVELRNLDSDAPRVSGELNAGGPDLPTLIEVVGMLQGGPDSTLSQAGRDLSRVPQKNFMLQTRFDADMREGRADLPEFELQLFGASISGRIQASNTDDTDRLLASGHIDASGPDLPLLMQIAGQLQGGRESALNELGLQLRTGVRDRSFSFATDFDADMARGNVELPALRASGLGFNLQADLNARQLQNSNGLINGSLSLQGQRLNEVLGALELGDFAEVAQSLELQMQIGGSSNNLRLSPLQLNAVVSGRQIPDSPQTLALSADTTVNLENMSLNADAFSLRGLGLNLSGNLKANDLDGAPTFSGELNVPNFNARRFLQQLNQPLPPMNDNSTLQNVSLNTAFGGSSGSFNLNDLDLRLDDSRITGSLALSDIETRSGQFSIVIDSINADRYMAPTLETAPADPAADPGPLPTELIRSMDLRGKLEIGQLTVSRLDMSEIVMEMAIQNGRASLSPFRAQLYDGSFNADIHLDAATDLPAASLSTSFNQVNLGNLLQDFMEASYVSGLGNLQLELSGRGADMAILKRSLNGSGSINLQDGVLDGVDVGAVLSTLETMIRSKQLLRLPEGGSTEFEQTSATLDISSGVVSSQDLSVRAPGWQLAGAGTLVDLQSEQINFNMLVAVDESTATSGETEYDLGGYRLPIACTGSISSPRCLPDAQQIIAAAVTNAVQQRIGDLLQDRLGGNRQQQDSTPQNEANPQQNQDGQQSGRELLNRALEDFLRR